MSFISLYVTQRVLDQLSLGNTFQQQIAIRDSSPDIAELMSTADAHNQIGIDVNGCFTLSAGDRNAFWAVHQSNEQQVSDFRDLFSLLARRPGIVVRFTW